MNDESPFRISSMLLTVACLVCGISAVVFVLPRYMQRTKSVDHATAAGELQLNLAEFHANQPNSAPEQDQPPTRRTLLPASSAIPQKTNIGINVASATHSESHRMGAVGAVRTASSNFMESTVVERHAHQWTSRGDSVPQLYAPVTVHPVTVNIDNTGIIREISRVNERLDSLAAEKSRFEKDVLARIEDANSGSARTAGPATVVEVHSPVPQHDVVSQSKGQSRVEPAPESTSTRVGTKVYAEADSTDALLPVDKPRSNTRQRTVERLKIAEPPVKVPHALVTAPELEPVAVPEPVSVPEPVAVPEHVSVPEPAVEPPVDFHSEAPVQPTPEIEFEVEPKTQVPDVPLLESPPAESEATEPQTVPEFEFSTELLPAPSPGPVTPEFASVIEFKAEPVSVDESLSPFDAIAVAEPVPVAEPGSQSVSEFGIATETEHASTDMKTVAPQTAEFPVLPDLTSPGLQWAKRTTDPPFRNGVIASRSAPPAASANKAPSKVQRVSKTVEASKEPEKPSNPTCRDCGKPRSRSDHKIKAVTPPSPIQRLRSFFK